MESKPVENKPGPAKPAWQPEKDVPKKEAEKKESKRAPPPSVTLAPAPQPSETPASVRFNSYIMLSYIDLNVVQNKNQVI